MSGVEEGRSLAGRSLAWAWLGAIGGAIAQGALYEATRGGVVGVVVPALLVGLGGILAGWSLGREATIRHYLAAVLIPATVAIPAFVLMAGLSTSADDLPAAILIAVAIYGLMALPMLLIVRRRRAP